jgi:peptidoglycan hydrolase-like protein with peptidoglycan-binding domain
MADHPVIKKGSKGDAVKKAQNALKARSYDPGPIDGIFGAKTFKAVRAYQSDRGLTADGIVGAKTWARLDPPTVKKGSTGAAVRMLQRLLADFGYDPGEVDGDFGAKTEKAVREFQGDFGLDVDGIVGPKTWAALGS